MRSSSRSTRARPRSSGSSSRARSSSHEGSELPADLAQDAGLTAAAPGRRGLLTASQATPWSRETETAFEAARLPGLSTRVAELPRERRRRRARVRLLWQWGLFLGSLLALSGTVLGLAFAGSPERLPAGSRIAGIDVAGLTPGDARAMLERRAKELGAVPVVFTADGYRWRVRPD